CGILAYRRRIGLDFDTAWSDALVDAVRDVDRREAISWLEAFAATRSAWQAAYLGHERVVCRLATMVA
ncbi:MAG: hypothetical protein QOF68_558, partial [Gaiellales bacterium]|nr:hypothetical protein [Gaiellales bacterium]